MKERNWLGARMRENAEVLQPGNTAHTTALSALDILQEVSTHVPKELDVVFEELVIDRRMVQVKGHSPSYGDVDKLRVALSRFEPFSEITVGDITNDARRGGRNFSVRISLAAGGDES